VPGDEVEAAYAAKTPVPKICTAMHRKSRPRFQKFSA